MDSRTISMTRQYLAGSKLACSIELSTANFNRHKNCNGRKLWTIVYRVAQSRPRSRMIFASGTSRSEATCPREL